MAQKYLTGKLREKDLGMFVAGSRQKLNDHFDDWLLLIQARVAQQTYESYEQMIRVHVRSQIGDRSLSEIKQHNVQAIYDGMRKSGRSPRTIRYVHAVLSMAFKKAIELNKIIRNPCEFVELPKLAKAETKAMTPAQSKHFVQIADNFKHGLVFELALITGMRPEEYLALRWSDISWEYRTASVRRALIWNRKGGGFYFGEPKTTKSRRSIPLPTALISKLRSHRREQLEQRLKLGQGYADLDLVFASELGTPLQSRNLAQREFACILKATGLEAYGFVLYSLRHTCATLLLAAGENPKVVAERLGHTSVKMTLDTYSHVLPDMQQSASDKLGRMLYA